MRKHTFMVGRATGRQTLVIYVGVLHADSPIAGPWTLRAVLSTN